MPVWTAATRLAERAHPVGDLARRAEDDRRLDRTAEEQRQPGRRPVEDERRRPRRSRACARACAPPRRSVRAAAPAPRSRDPRSARRARSRSSATLDREHRRDDLHPGLRLHAATERPARGTSRPTPSRRAPGSSPPIDRENREHARPATSSPAALRSVPCGGGAGRTRTSCRGRRRRAIGTSRRPSGTSRRCPSRRGSTPSVPAARAFARIASFEKKPANGGIAASDSVPIRNAAPSAAARGRGRPSCGCPARPRARG